jgi:hypothetical protein
MIFFYNTNSFLNETSFAINLNYSRRTYSTIKPADSEVESNIKDTSDSSINNGNTCHYTNIYSITNLELGLARTKSGISAGLDGEIKANYVDKPNKIKDLSDKLKLQKYKPSPAKKV